jgi:hypothetical protein
VELLITRIQFDDGRSSGISLAMLGRTKKPNMKVLFVARPVYEGLTQGIGEFLPWDCEHRTDRGGSTVDASRPNIVTERSTNRRLAIDGLSGVLEVQDLTL